jgi:hypothetical protein
MPSWASTAQAIRHWPDAAQLNVTRLEQLLASATRDVIAAAPASKWHMITPVTLTTGSAAFTTTDVLGLTAADVELLAIPAVPGQLPVDVTVAAVSSATAGTLSAAALATTSSATLTLLPVSFMLATVYQAREVYSASVRDGDLIGAGDYAIRARPLTASVKQLVRPAGPPIGVG